jgi:hypothetical protein
VAEKNENKWKRGKYRKQAEWDYDHEYYPGNKGYDPDTSKVEKEKTIRGFQKEDKRIDEFQKKYAAEKAKKRVAGPSKAPSVAKKPTGKRRSGKRIATK